MPCSGVGVHDADQLRSGNPEHPHQRKHAFDLGEYGAGYMANSLTLGCDCKGSIHYLDAEFAQRDGTLRKIKNAICIHEEDAGILFKHTDFRDESSIVTRARKLIIQQVFTAANYEYAVQWTFHVSQGPLHDVAGTVAADSLSSKTELSSQRSSSRAS